MGNNKINNEISDDLLGKVSAGAKGDVLELDGSVVEELPNAMFKVKLINGKIINAHISGKLRMNYIKVKIGDEVKVEISPYDLTKGRIVYLYK